MASKYRSRVCCPRFIPKDSVVRDLKIQEATKRVVGSAVEREAPPNTPPARGDSVASKEKRTKKPRWRTRLETVKRFRGTEVRGKDAGSQKKKRRRKPPKPKSR
jgi:hypothetical protein